MKVSKMMIHYTLLFSVPTAVALYYYNPKSDEQIRKDVVRALIPLSQSYAVCEARELTLIGYRKSAFDQTRTDESSTSKSTPSCCWEEDLCRKSPRSSWTTSQALRDASESSQYTYVYIANSGGNVSGRAQCM